MGDRDTFNDLTAILAGNFLNLALTLIFLQYDFTSGLVTVLLSWGSAYASCFFKALPTSRWAYWVSYGLNWMCVGSGVIAFAFAVIILI